MSWNESFTTAKNFISKGLFHAATAMFQDLERRAAEQPARNRLGELYYEQGRIYMYKDVNYKEAVRYFTKAMENTNIKDEKVKYTIYLSVAYLRMAEFDTCYRYLTSLAEDMDGIGEQTKGILLANLSAIQGINGFYDQAIESTERSMKLLSGSDNPINDITLNNNKGLAYLEMGIYDKAEFHLKQALELGGSDFLEPLTELGRLYMFQGNIVESVEYAKRALNIIWSSIINYNKEEVARLCHLLSSIAVRIDERLLAIRLGEKAQVFFGQLGMWRQWQNVESQMEQWLAEPPVPYTGDGHHMVSFNEIHHFLQCLEALNAQELIHKSVSKLLDVRVYYVQLFAQALGLSERDQEDLVLASRFADYGLSALENEVVLNPTRSEMAFAQYKQHPSLSVRMVKTLNLSDRITEIIEDHHEHYDGSGYPKGKIGEEINGLARILSITDRYATGVVRDQKSHFEVIEEITAGSGTEFDPKIVIAFNKMCKVL